MIEWATHPTFIWLAGVALGFAAGVHLDSMLRRRPQAADDTLKIEYIRRDEQTATAPVAVHRDVSLNEALAYACFRDWGRTAGQAAASGGVDLNHRIREFEQLARDGKLSVWGKKNLFAWGPFDTVPCTHWRDYEIDFYDLLRGAASTKRRNEKSIDGNFIDLQVSRLEFEREWPHA
jgi:hypothetical protein